MMTTVGAKPRILVVQARLESGRRSGKSLATIHDKPLLSHVVERAIRVGGVDAVYLATTTRPADDELAAFVALEFPHSVRIFRGSSSDVQSRFASIGELHQGSNIGRITADDPFKDPVLYEQAFELLEESQADYVSMDDEKVPLGMNVEVFSQTALEKSTRLFPNDANREHVTWSLAREEIFVRATMPPPSSDNPGVRLTVDFEDDIVFASAVARNIQTLGGSFSYATTVAAVELTASASEGAFQP
jgi:spore coat polysaccharide biosynthesis protein SpsF